MLLFVFFNPFIERSNFLDKLNNMNKIEFTALLIRNKLIQYGMARLHSDITWQ